MQLAQHPPPSPLRVRARTLLAIRLWLWLLTFASILPCSAASRSSDRIWSGGKEYVRVASWAKSSGLQVSWVKRGETLLLSNRANRVNLRVTSREAAINGVRVWLLLPVLSRGGLVYLSQLDAQQTMAPVLSPPRCRTGTSIRTICLDAGHGGTDPGHRTGKYTEKTYTLLLAQELRAQLQKAGFKVTLTRTGDSTMKLEDRPARARSQGADLFLSLHFNASGSARSSAKGTEVYCLTPVGAASTNARGEGAGATAAPGNRQNDHNMALAFHLQKTLTTRLPVEDRGVRRARFMVLRNATMPAALIEAGFLSHPTEGPKIAQSAHRQQMAKAIVEAVQAYKRQAER